MRCWHKGKRNIPGGGRGTGSRRTEGSQRLRKPTPVTHMSRCPGPGPDTDTDSKRAVPRKLHIDDTKSSHYLGRTNRMEGQKQGARAQRAV